MNKILHLLGLLFCLIISESVIAAEQNYLAILSTSNPILASESYVSYGKAFPDRIELYEIDELNNGFIEFSIEVINNVDVSLARKDEITDNFGFKFDASHFLLIVNGITQPVTGGISDSYNSSNTFRVEKCDDKIFYFKDGELLFSYCGSETNIGALFHRTDIIDAADKQLNLLFESDMGVCQTSLTSSPIVQSKTSDNTAPTSTINQLLLKKRNPRSYHLINIYDEDMNPIAQYRRRTDFEGVLMGTREIEQLLSQKPNLSMAIKEERK